MFCSGGCEYFDEDDKITQEVQELATDLLEPGGYVEGPAGVRIISSEDAFHKPVELLLEIGKVPAEIGELPKPLKQVQKIITMEASSPVVASEDGWFAASFPVPEGANPEELAFAIWTPPHGPFANSGTDSGEEEGEQTGYWLILDGVVEDDRFDSLFYILPDEPYFFVLAEGEWFDPHGQGDKSGEENDELGQLQQGLGQSVNLLVKCEKNDADVCTSAQRARFGAYLEETMLELDGRTLGQYSFPNPRLRKLGSGSDNDYVVYLRMMREKGMFGDKCRYWLSEDGGYIGVSGAYNRGSRKLTACIWPSDKAAPTIVIGPGVGNIGTQYTIEIDSTTITETVQADDDAAAIAQRLAEEIRNEDSTPHSLLIDSSRAEAFGNRVALNYDMSDRASTPTVQVSVSDSSGSISIEDFEYSVLHTGNHEYFHALQHAVAPTHWFFPDIHNFYLEGTAVASERARYREDEEVVPMERNTTRNLRSLTARNFFDGDELNQDHYRGQDFFVFVGHLLGRGIEWVIPMMEDGGSAEMQRQTLSALGTSRSEAHWAYVRNNAFEKRFALDRVESIWDDHCQLDHNQFDSSAHKLEVDYTGGVQTETVDVSRFKGSYVEISFGSAYSGQDFVIEAQGFMSATKVAVYRDDYAADESCVVEDDNTGSDVRPREVVNIDVSAGSSQAYVLATTIVPFDVLKVTIRPANTSVTLDHENGDVEIAGRSIVVGAEYVGESAPVESRWFFNGDEFAEGDHDSQLGNISATLSDPCPLGTGQLRVEVEDAWGTQAVDNVDLELHMAGSQVNLGIPNTFRCGRSFELPVTSDDVFDDMIVTPTFQGCQDYTEPNDWQWEVTHADGSVTVDQADRFKLSKAHFTQGDSYGAVAIEVTHPELVGEVSTTIRPCFFRGTDSLGSCYDPALCYGVSHNLGIDAELMRLRDQIDIIMTFDYRLDNIFDDLVPDPFPFPGEVSIDKLGHYVDATVVGVLSTINDALEASTMGEFETGLEKARADSLKVTDKGDAYFVGGIFVLIDAHLDYYTDFSEGGVGGWYDFSFLKGWTANGPNPIEPTHSAYLYAVHTWLDAFEKREIISISGEPLTLDDPEITERAFNAASQGSLRDLIDKWF